MAAIVHCDTHTILWLYAGETERFGPKAIKAIETSDLVVSPMVRLEVCFLYEIERISQKPDHIFKVLKADFGVQVSSDPFEVVAAAAETITWTRDPFDRLIVAQALLKHSPLITKDSVIQKHYKHSVW